MDSNVSQGHFRYFVALDFGTHGSGFSYSAKVDGNCSPRTYENWPGQRGTPAAKTRTALLYRADDLSKPLAWGWAAIQQYAELPEQDRPGCILLEGFKKHLMPDDFPGLPKLPAGLSPLKLVTDFLACLVNEVVCPTLQDHYGSRFHPCAVRWCLTVPAGLSQSSIALMRRAAMAAGIIPSSDSPALLITSEPEAAALTAKQHRDLLGLSTGGRLMIIDMGGGTVDMTIHEVDTKDGAVSLAELTHRECMPEGATRVDERFKKYVAGVVGSSAFDMWLQDPANAGDVQEFVYDEWEVCKCSVLGGQGSGGPASYIQVNLPYSLACVAEASADSSAGLLGSDRLLLSPAVMEGFFRPSLQVITSTAQAMLARAGGADVIVLVGGFSASRFVRRELAAALEQAGSAPVVAQEYGATAVLEGGVWLSRYPGAVAGRRARLTYGIRTATTWEPGAPDKTYLVHSGRFVCTDGFATYVKRDELIKAGSVLSKDFWPLYPHHRSVAFDIYGCLHKDAKYTTEDSMVKIASVVLDTPLCGAAPGANKLTAHFNFSETQISVSCMDRKTGRTQQAQLLFDSAEVVGEAGVSAG